MKTIPLYSYKLSRRIIEGPSAFKVALVDDDDYAWLIDSPYNWKASKHGYIWYARRTVPNQASAVLMHRLILGAKKGEITDHINGDGLDNQRHNLRFATTRQNDQNQRRVRPSSSQYQGVSIEKATGIWVAMIGVDKKVIRLGRYASEEEAAKAYDIAALKHYGSNAKVNFPLA